MCSYQKKGVGSLIFLLATYKHLSFAPSQANY